MSEREDTEPRVAHVLLGETHARAHTHTHSQYLWLIEETLPLLILGSETGWQQAQPKLCCSLSVSHYC